MMFSNCAVFSLIVFLAVVNDVASKYSADDNRIIKRLYGSKQAKLFLNECNDKPYIDLTTSTATTTESKYFEMHKSNEYSFAVFTLNEVSLIISNANITARADENNTQTECEKEIVMFNITLGIKKNSMAMLEVFVNKTLIGNKTATIVHKLPTIPYYVNVTITDNNISVFEARAGALDPFLQLNYSHNFRLNLTVDSFFVKFRHSSPIFAHYDCCETCSPWIYSRISGCSKYSARTASTESEATHSLIGSRSWNRTENILFSENFVVNHNGNPTFGAKIIFSENENLRSRRYEIGLSNTPTIVHYVNASTQLNKTGVTLKQEYTLPFIVNITITRDGIVSLRRPNEENPFLKYTGRRQPLTVKYMTMVKFHDDFVRYDFFYNCTELEWSTKKQKVDFEFGEADLKSADQSVDNISYPIIWKYISKQFKETKFDVLHVYQDNYQIDENSQRISYEDSSDDDEEDISTNSTDSATTSNNTNMTKSEDSASTWDLFKKAVVGIFSFLFIAILKCIFSMNCAKELMKAVDVDDDQAKNLRKSVSNVVSKNIEHSLSSVIDE